MKNRVLRSALAVILVIAMVLTMAACNNTDPVETTAPVVTVAPAATTTPTDAPVATVTPTEAPAEEVVDTDEAQLNEYGITFPEFDLEYLAYTDSDFDKDSMTFGLKVDEDNDYQNAYEFSITAKISATALDGSSLSKSKYSLSSLYTSTELSGYTVAVSAATAAADTDGYYDAGSILDWNDTAKYYFQVGAAGIYTVTYTIEVEHDKDYSYGYYTPGEVDEKYTITKTYTVEKAELALKTSDDAFQVESNMFFVDASVNNSDTFKSVATDYSYAVDVTSCTGTEVGEYTLAITLTDKNDAVVDPSDIELSNYYVTVTEGTRYILSKEDVAKANAVRKMYATDDAVDVTTEYSQETITYYNTLTEGQKVMAAADSDMSIAVKDRYAEADRLDDYLVVQKPVNEDAIEEAEYNMNRDYIIDEVEDAIEAYMTASTTAKKDAALTTLAELILSIDNTANEYGSDISYVLTALANGVYVPSSEWGVATYTNDAITAVTYYAYYGVNKNSEGAYAWTELTAGQIVDFATYSEGVYKVAEATTDTSISAESQMAYVDFSGAPTTTQTGFTLTAVATDYDVTNTTAIYVVTTGDDYNTTENIVAFQNEEDDDEYDVTFGYGITGSVVVKVNDVYDDYLSDWIDDYNSFLEALANIDFAINFGGELTQSLIDDLTKYAGNLEGEYADLITYQLSLKGTKFESASTVTTWYDSTSGTAVEVAYYAVGDSLGTTDSLAKAGWYAVVVGSSTAAGDVITDYSDFSCDASMAYGSGDKVSVLHADALAAEAELVSRWDAYIALIEAYGFEDSYIDNANQDDLAATFQAMYMLIGYDFENSVLAADFDNTSSFEKTLSNVLFNNNTTLYPTSGEVYYAPNLFVDGALAAAEQMMQIAIAVQSETDAVKQDIINYVVSTGYYTSNIDKYDARPEYIASLEYAALYYGGTGYEADSMVYIELTGTDGDFYVFLPETIPAALASDIMSDTTIVADVTISDATYVNDFITYVYAIWGVDLSAFKKESNTTTFTSGDVTAISTSIDEAGCLDEIQAWVDYQVLAQALYDSSDFWKDLEKKGMDTAMTEMFEEIIESVQDRVDDMDKAIEDGTFTIVATQASADSNEITITVPTTGNYGITTLTAGSGIAVETGVTATIAGTTTFTVTYTAEPTDGATFTVTEATSGAYAYLGTVDVVIEFAEYVAD
ncbi:MAG: hypothetical protein R3Y45_02770 [Bacillota bacterium]